MTIAEKLKTLREEHKMTLEDVASSIGVGRATVFKYENGIITNIPLDKIELLSKLFSVSPAYLIGWEERNPLPQVNVTVSTDEARILSRGIDRLPKEQREQALAMFRVMFEPQYADLFTKEDGFFFAALEKPRFPLFFNGFEVCRSVPLCSVIGRCYS